MQRQKLFVAILCVLATCTANVNAASDLPATPGEAEHADGATAGSDADQDVRDGSAKAATDPTRLEGITVTARKREETLQDVPVSVSAFTARTLDSLNVRDIGDLQGQVPNLSIYAARGSNSTLTAYIRGIGQSDPLWGFEPGVGIYLDDVYIARPQGALLDVFDVSRIEVLRGPQGTLYGKNTIGGAVKYISNPLPTSTEAFATVALGNYAERDVKAGFGGASADGVWRARVAAASVQHDGFGKNLITGDDVSDKNTQAARGTFGFFPNATFNAQLSVDASNDNSSVRGAKRLAINKFDPNKTPPNASDFDVQNGMPNKNGTHMSGAALTANWLPFDSWQFKSTTAYRRSYTNTNIDFDTLPQAITDVRATYRDHQFTQEFQGNYDAGGQFHAVTGLYYFNGSASGLVRNNFLNASFGTTSGTVGTESVAAYADGTWAFNDRLSLSGGLRYTHEEKTADVFNRSYTDATFTKPVATLANFDKSLTANNVSPRLSLDYHLDPSILLYASVSRGFKSGGYNIRANTLAVPDSAHPFKDEKVDAYEIGSKMAFLDDRLFINTALFYNRYHNIQLSVFSSYTLPNGTQGFFGDFTNAGKANVKGAEVEFSVKPAEYWTVTGNLAWLDPKYTEYFSSGVNVASKQKFTNAPHFQGGFNVLYTHPIGNDGDTLEGRVGYRYQSKVYPTTDLSEAIAQDSYGVLDAGLIWRTAGHWSFALEGKNLTDKSYRTTGYNIPALGILTGFYGAPRQVAVSATWRF
ncbi:TonB-dependent receptor [Dokdonella soli]|uniref:TonB-dependent receptor n=1 Tax=Dokdonella soli TaxID=529810 RepID=A0ABP3TL89_9GAMM